jgi:predicted cobalt transporter CbtA
MRWLVFVVVALLAAPGCHASGTPLPVDGTSCSGCDNRFTCSSTDNGIINWCALGSAWPLVEEPLCTTAVCLG